MNTELIKNWIEKNGPQGLNLLSGKSKVSAGTINKILNENHEPGLDIVKKLARVIGVSLDEIASEDEAS